VTDKKNIVVFGIGWLGKEAVRHLKNNNQPLVAICDDYANLASFEKVPVCRSTGFSIEARSKMRLLVAIDNPEYPLLAVMDRLKKDHWAVVEPYINYHWRELPPWIWMGDQEYHVGREAEIEEAKSLWADAASSKLFTACVQAHKEQNILNLPPPSPYQRLKRPERFDAVLASWSIHEIYSYFCTEETGRWPEPLRYLECGAYDGSDLAAAEAAGYKVEAYAGLEPDPANYRQIAKVVRKVPGANAYPLAVSDQTEQLRFQMDGEKGCIGQGDTVVQAVSIDDAFFNFRPSLITMDVEGSEASVLRGARETIQAHRPGLAVRVYHRPDDFYALPLLVKELTKGLKYQFLLRRYLTTMFDMTFYAVPM